MPMRNTKKNIILYNRMKFHDNGTEFAAYCEGTCPASYDAGKLNRTVTDFLESHRITPYGFCQKVPEDNEGLYRYGREIAMLNALKAGGMIGDTEYARIKQSIRKAYRVDTIAETGNDVL